MTNLLCEIVVWLLSIALADNSPRGRLLSPMPRENLVCGPADQEILRFGVGGRGTSSVLLSPTGSSKSFRFTHSLGKEALPKSVSAAVIGRFTGDGVRGAGKPTGLMARSTKTVSPAVEHRLRMGTRVGDRRGAGFWYVEHQMPLFRGVSTAVAISGVFWKNAGKKLISNNIRTKAREKMWEFFKEN